MASGALGSIFSSLGDSELDALNASSAIACYNSSANKNDIDPSITVTFGAILKARHLYVALFSILAGFLVS